MPLNPWDWPPFSSSGQALWLVYSLKPRWILRKANDVLTIYTFQIEKLKWTIHDSLRLLTGFWLRALWLDTVPSYLIHIYLPRVTFHHVVIQIKEQIIYLIYTFTQRTNELNLFLCLDYHAHILVQDFGDFDKKA